jgi:UDP-N-acetyl-2-amino-2-deoxyglucuronate dehydrogenase
MKNFALIGAAGFVAERHLKAIRDTGNKLFVASDKFDVMGKMDSYFPDAEFFPDFESFDQFIKVQQKSVSPIEYCSICSPNFLHCQHIEFALENAMNAICEKPLVIYPSEIKRLEKAEKESGHKIHTILQLRLHPVITVLRQRIQNEQASKVFDIDLTYITSRGKWYFKSWKGDVTKSGGVAANIGIHFFDMLTWIFGPVEQSIVHKYEPHRASGFLKLERARVRWFLSLDYNDIPEQARIKGSRTYRSITIGGEEIEFSEGFTDLHTTTYREILANGGFGLEEAKPCIYLTHDIRNSTPVGLKGDYHPFLKKKE